MHYSECEQHLPQNFCQRQTERRFPKVVKSCSEYPKTCKSFKNQYFLVFMQEKVMKKKLTKEEKKNKKKTGYDLTFGNLYIFA